MTQATTQIANILQGIIDGFEGRLLKIEQSYTSSQTAVRELTTQADDLETSNSTLQERIEELEEANTSLRSEIAELKEAYVSAQTTLTTEQDGNASIREELNAIQETLQRSNTRLDAFVSWRDAVNTKIARAETKVTGAATASNTAQNSQAQVANQLKQLQETTTKQHK